jgi:hypothetical protein
MDKDEIVKEFYTLKDVYNKGWIDDSEFQQRKRQLVDRVTNTTYGEIWNGPGSPSRNGTPAIVNISPANPKATISSADNNGRKSFSEESHDLLHQQQNGQNNGANTKERSRNAHAESSNSHSDGNSRPSQESNGKDPGFESVHPITVSLPNGTGTASEDRNNSDNIHSDAESRKKVASIEALINKNSPPPNSQPTIVYPMASPGLMMDGIMPIKRMRRGSASEPANEDLPEAPFRRQENNANETNTHKRNYEAALGALTSMSTHIQQDEYERQKKRQRLDPDAEVIVVPAAMANRDVHNGKMPIFIGQALNIGTLNEKDLVIKSLSEELRKTQTKLRDYEHLEREREIKRQEEERWINMVVDYPRPTMPMYAQNTNNAAYIQSLPLVPSLGNTVPSLSSLGNSSGSQANSNTGPNPTGMPREPGNSSMPPSVTIPAPNPPPTQNNNGPAVGTGPNNPIIMMSTITTNGSGHKSPPPPSGTVSPVPGQVIPPMKLNGAPAFQLHVASQPPARVVYQRILKPFPQVQVLGPHQQYQNLYIEATLLRRDTHEEVPHLDGNTLVRVWNGFATFRKLKVTSTSQQSGTLFQLKFSLKQYDSANFKPMACNTVISEPIEVFSHSQYLKQ